MARVLVIEDELPMRTALCDCLEARGHRLLTAADGEGGLRRALEQKPDLILLDVMMPRLDGFAVCRELRRLGVEIPILILTAKGQIEDRVVGLDSGADDYLVKPFSTEELLARVRALLRRVERPRSHRVQVRFGALDINFARQTARRGNESIHFTAKEFAVLRLLVDSAGEPVSRERFLDWVWGHAAFPTTRTVDNHIAMLRRKIEPDPKHPQFIKTVHGVGYRLEFEEPILHEHDNPRA